MKSHTMELPRQILVGEKNINEFGEFRLVLDKNNMPVPFTPNFATTRQAKELEEEIASKQVTRDEAREKIEEQKRIDEIFSNVYF